MAALPEPLSLMPGPARTESRCAPAMTTLSSFAPVFSASTLNGRQGLAQRVGEHPHPQPGRVAPASPQRVGGADHRDAAGVVGREGDGRDALAVGAAVLPWLKITMPDGAGGRGVLGLELERAGATLEQRDVPGREAGEVRSLAAAGRGVAEAELQVDGRDRRGDVARDRTGRSRRSRRPRRR